MFAVGCASLLGLTEGGAGGVSGLVETSPGDLTFDGDVNVGGDAEGGWRGGGFGRGSGGGSRLFLALLFAIAFAHFERERGSLVACRLEACYGEGI